MANFCGEDYYIGMDKQLMIELFGYLGSLLVLVSFLMTSVFKLRVINTIGSIIFTIYALIIHSYPTAVMNACLVLVNLHFLWKMRHTGRHYDLVRVNGDDRYLNYIIASQMNDIEKSFPGITIKLGADLGMYNRCYIVTCAGNPAGIVIGNQENETITLSLDYSLQEYRDFSIGAFLFRRLKEEGIKKVVYLGPTENHMAYLNKMGFKNDNGMYEKVLS